MTATTLLVIGLALGLDLVVGEPRTAFHPVAWFGRVVALVDREWTLEPGTERWLGVGVALALPLLPAAVAGGFVLLATAFHPFAGILAATVVLALTTSVRMLLDLTQEVIEATAADLETARERVRGLVGRDATTLTDEDVRSAAIESAAENLADGFASTLLPFALLAPISLPTAAAVAAWVKGVNTLDSMLGYPEKPIGTASARLDDAMMYLPARATALCLALASRRPRALAQARRWARVPASPNSGWPMATLACGLDVRLEKPDAYVLCPDASPPTLADGRRAVSVVGLAAVCLVGLAALFAVVAPALEWVVGSSFEALAAGQPEHLEAGALELALEAEATG
ncbi:adenosylcobinamide-phosphate synthase CbiB [Natronosalvus vescus]|uniref:adenosylcobinamide-phosphate synthase CbiB n=1 Tax=Natronosalvus vescus TaxID=2953881 RepID=UPI0020916A21|nr:adenosylcobinamide-phosphate synthase CbiB [Natronosalvus vescus]